MEDLYLTKEGHKKLADKLDFLKTVCRKELSKAIEVARAHGDISENAEYDAAKEEQGLNEKRIFELEEKLGRARIINNDDMPTDRIFVGASVKIKDMNSKEELEYMIVSEAEADYSQGKISMTSPVGKALMGHKENEVIDIKIPAGVLKYKIIKISR